MLVGIALAVCGVACGGGGGGNAGGGTGPPANDLSGSCTAMIEGTRDGQPFQTNGTFDLVQTGDQVAGTWTTTNGTAASDQSGTISGVIAGITLTFVLTQDAPCAATFTGRATAISTTSIAGDYDGSSCLGDDLLHFAIVSCVPAVP